MHDVGSFDLDDLPRGRLLSRRDMLRRIGLFPAALLLACRTGDSPTPTGPATLLPPTATPDPATASSATTVPLGETLPACVAVPELTEGPYFVDERLERSDIRVDPTDGTVVEGVPLRLTLRIYRLGNACTPLSGATVDLWQCDALGVYSDVADPQFDTRGKKFLRGFQRTDSSGTVEFLTIYPGWYRGRAVHIHFKIRTDPDSPRGYEFTSQFFFDDTLTDRVHAQPPYDRKGQRDTRNAQDAIFRGGGSQLVLPVVETSEGYASLFSLGLAF
ncbi:MAG: intradiol ring-cleavage dioxygenase [Thermomicrobium sp.]|nr:intradiol ring-cleavage dioxygenase [Thermomicrobium sp.]MDW8060824.1 intradiol ring-cleavage dioxygenase [Thermomicrobium sp.]